MNRDGILKSELLHDEIVNQGVHARSQIVAVNTLSLQHFDGVDGSIIIPPDDVAGVSWVNEGGNSTLRSAFVAFGPTSFRHSVGAGPLFGFIATGWALDESAAWAYEWWVRVGSNGKLGADWFTRGYTSNFLLDMGFAVTLHSEALPTLRLELFDGLGMSIHDSTVAIVDPGSVFLHRALSFNGTAYQMYNNGVRTHNVVSSTPVRDIDKIISRGDNSNFGYTDEFRLSRGDRGYTGASITVPIAPFVVD